MTTALPSVLLSREAVTRAAGLATGPKLPLTDSGTTFTMAQEAAWIDAKHYAVGRWDGSLSIFTFTDALGQRGPVIAKAVNSPANEGLQMITPVQELGAFVSSNDQGSMIVWRTADGTWTDLRAAATLIFPDELGVANSGCITQAKGEPYFVAGHANGRVTIWAIDADLSKWKCVATIDVRSGRPVNPWGLTNVRGMAAIPGDASNGYVVTGSEDGNLTVVRIPDGRIMSAVVYNPAAKRGINSLAANGSTVLVANCAVGPADSNLWCYVVDSSTWRIRNTDRANLAINPKALQVFNFDIALASARSGNTYLFCSTEEGALWMARLAGDKLVMIGHEVVTHELGSALCFQDGKLALTAYDLKEYLFAE